MTSIDQQFIEYIIKSLVGKPDAVQIDRRVDDKGVLLELTVDPEDLGRVIGKKGATAQSLRTLLRALGTKNEERYNLKIVDNGDPRPGREERRDDSDSRQDESPSSSAGGSDDNSGADDSKASDDSWGSTSSSYDDEEDKASDKLSKTRKELDDLDDLDI